MRHWSSSLLLAVLLFGCADADDAVEASVDIDPVRSGPSDIADSRADSLYDAEPGAARQSDEHCFLSAINAARAAEGLPVLEHHFGMTSWARFHSIRMQSAGYIYHSSELVEFGAPGWRRLG